MPRVRMPPSDIAWAELEELPIDATRPRRRTSYPPQRLRSAPILGRGILSAVDVATGPTMPAAGGRALAVRTARPAPPL
jgi:hypothetical protein